MEAITFICFSSLNLSSIPSQNHYRRMCKETNKISLNVVALVNDMGSNNLNLTNTLNVTIEKPYFNINSHKIIYIFDVSHLIKATWNYFLKHSFHFDDKKTSWKFVEDFYNQDKLLGNRLAPKLTDSHLYPSCMKKSAISRSSFQFHCLCCSDNICVFGNSRTYRAFQ